MTALTSMAAARPPGIADARVPCPLCGGLIHPVAGRCKHCKEDLSTYRAGRPAAAAALPALDRLATSQAAGTNGHIMATPVPVAMPAREGSQPILPPRTTARTIPVQRTHGIWRSWPMLVIALAVVAIIAATVVMILPQDKKHGDGKMSAPPAPERMDTNPLPDKHSQTDPWGGQPGTVPQIPDPPTNVAPQPLPPADPDDDDDNPGLGGGGLGGGSFGANFAFTAFDRACKRMKTCGDVDPTVAMACDTLSKVPKPPLPSMSTCPAAQRCLDSIDHMACSEATQLSPATVLTLSNDCLQTIGC